MNSLRSNACPAIQHSALIVGVFSKYNIEQHHFALMSKLSNTSKDENLDRRKMFISKDQRNCMVVVEKVFIAHFSNCGFSVKMNSASDRAI